MNGGAGASPRFTLFVVAGLTVLGLIAVSVLYLGMIEPFVEAARNLPAPQ